MKLEASILLVFQLHVFVVRAQFMQISRPRSGVDIFNLPPWMCSDARFSCSSFNAVGEIRNCSCLCSIPNATFSFFNNQLRWVCMRNRQTRDHIQQGKLFGYVSSHAIISGFSPRKVSPTNFGYRVDLSWINGENNKSQFYNVTSCLFFWAWNSRHSKEKR